MTKNVPVNLVMSTEVIPVQPTLIVLATKAIPAALFQPVMVKEAISEFLMCPQRLYLSGVLSAFWP